jgi:hypothetical protein
VKFILQYWPDTRIVFRGDSGFYRPRLLNWCDRNNVDYLVGISKNSRLLKDVDVRQCWFAKLTGNWGKKSPPPTGSNTRLTSGNTHAGGGRLEEGELGSNPRFIVSSRYDDGFKLYY